MKNNKGFSLVELIIVIAIMAVLVGVLAPTYLQYVEKSKKSNDVSTVDSVINACEIAAIDPEVMSDGTTELKITFYADGTTPMNIAPTGETAGITTTWKKAVETAVGADVKLKSKNWGKNVIIIATRNPATGSVEFSYDTANSSTVFSAYATALTKVKNS